MIVPMVGSTAIRAIARPFRLNLVAPQLEPKMTTIWITPNGMLKRMASNLVYPKSLMIRFPKVEMPPLAILCSSKFFLPLVFGAEAFYTYEMATIATNQHQVLKSMNVSQT